VKVYLVQCWDKRGALTNNYETLIDSDEALVQLKRFLKQKHGYVVLTLVPAKKAKAK
jgi:hypothetical protein